MGAWIETHDAHVDEKSKRVAPHVGAWIETSSTLAEESGTLSRTPCGCVD